MRVRSNRRHLLLLLALGVPCVCLIALGILLIQNSRELARSRAKQERQRRVAQIGDELLASLERTKLNEAGSLAVAGGEASNPDRTIPMSR